MVMREGDLGRGHGICKDLEMRKCSSFPAESSAPSLGIPLVPWQNLCHMYPSPGSTAK